MTNNRGCFLYTTFVGPQMFDGWVLKGEKFPSSQDHQLPLHQRYTDYCSSPAAAASSRSSQNVAMIFFRLHSADSGFTLAVKKLHNPFRESTKAKLNLWLKSIKEEVKLLNKKAKLQNKTRIRDLHQVRVCVCDWRRGSDWCYLLVCMHVCSSWTFVLGRALIRAESDRERLNERDAPVLQLLGKHGVNTVSSSITLTVWLRDTDGQTRSTHKISLKRIVCWWTAWITAPCLGIRSYNNHQLQLSTAVNILSLYSICKQESAL